MHWLDITLLIVLGLGLVLGFRSGLLWQVARLVTFCVAIYVCIYGHAFLYDQLQPRLPGWAPWLVHGGSYVAAFLGVYLVLYTLTWLVERWLSKKKTLKLIDRVLGAALGAVKWSLVAGAVLFGVAVFATEQSKSVLAESTLAPPLLTVMQGVIVLVPQEYKTGLAEALDQIKATAVARAEEAARTAAQKAIPDLPKPSSSQKSPR